MIDPFFDIREIAALNGGDFEKVCKAHTGNAYLGNNVSLCRILSKYKLYVGTQDLGVTPHLIMDGFWETWLTQCLAQIVQPGDVCLDVGANFGYYTLLMSELCGKEGKTLAIEPNPKICELLRSSQSIHSWKFDIIEAAISNKRGNMTLTVPATYPGNASLLSLHLRNSGKTTKIKVRTLTIDELVKQQALPKVDIIKIDVEGVEPLVFEGMHHTIATNPELKIVMEYSPFMYADARKFTNYLFTQFIVQRIKDVDKMEELDESAIEGLLQLTDHTDLYLKKKPAP